ncbi:MAG: hypothetical protein EP335_06925 [Alphaproteobacteria bacterium]|nr:MAG: hypothetical protein EP335_06925 [Alphaproteobacteria bacterium]
MTDKISRKQTAEAFEKVIWQDNDSNLDKTIQELKRAALARVDAEIHWYEQHAGFHFLGFKFYSYALRILALFLALAGTLLIEVATFYSSLQDGHALPFLWRFGIEKTEIPFFSVALLLAAGFFAMIDKQFMITKGMARFRAAEYSLRVLRAELEAELVVQIQQLPIPCTKGAFNALRALAAKHYVDIMREVKAETVGWSEDVKANMDALIEEIVRQKINVRDQASKLQDEIIKGSKKFPLKIIVENSDNRAGKKFAVGYRTGQSAGPTPVVHTFDPGESWTVLLPAEGYLIELEEGGTAIASEYVQLSTSSGTPNIQEVRL